MAALEAARGCFNRNGERRGLAAARMPRFRPQTRTGDLADQPEAGRRGITLRRVGCSS